MTLKTIYIVRHGYRANWLPPPHPPCPTGIDSDPTLLPHGDDQAVELGHYILSLDPTEIPQMIFSSPFYRCVQTATPLLKLLNLRICPERGIGEWFKRERAIHPVPADTELLSKFFDTLDTDYKQDSLVVPSTEGETEAEVFERCKTFIFKFISFMNEKHPDVERVILVTHAATKIALGMALLGYNSPRETLKSKDVLENEIRLRAGTCSLDKFELDPLDQSSWNIVMNGNVEFLSLGEEMNWSFEYGFEAGSDEDIKARQLKLALKESEEFDEVYVTLEMPATQQMVSSNLSNASHYYNRVLIEELSRTNNLQSKLELPSKGANSSSSPASGSAGQAASSASGKNSKGPNEHLNSLYASNSLQVSGLETENPLLLINQQLFKGEYRKLNGTELIVNDDGDVMAKSRDRILLHKSEFTRKKIDSSNGANASVDDEEELKKEVLKSVPELVAKSKNSNLIEKLMLLKKIELGLPK